MLCVTWNRKIRRSGKVHMKISKKAQAIEPSLSRHLFNMAKEYSDVIDLTLGDPDIPPCRVIKEAACDAVQLGKLRYSANAGLQLLRESIARNFEDEYGISIEPTKNIIITVGGMEALFLALACMLDKDDEVIIIAPYYVNYKQMIAMCGGKAIIVNTTESNNFVPNAEEIEKVITDKTVAMIINSPSNPTGAVYDKEALESIATIAREYDLSVISDEVYRTLIYDDVKHESIAKLPGMQERTIVVDSFSKRFAMTGYRLGYAIAPKDLIENMTKMQENVAACAPVSSQYAGISALEQCSQDTFIRDEFEKRRDYVYNELSAIDALVCNKPVATFYLFVNVEKTGLDGLEFAYRLLEQEKVAVVPGITYGADYKGYIRIAYTMQIEQLKIAMKRIRRFIDNLAR